MDIQTVCTAVTTVGTAIKEIASDEKIQSFVCGTYTDGTPRNINDAMKGEYLSPKSKVKMEKKKKKKKKNKFKL